MLYLVEIPAEHRPCNNGCGLPYVYLYFQGERSPTFEEVKKAALEHYNKIVAANSRESDYYEWGDALEILEAHKFFAPLEPGEESKDYGKNWEEVVTIRVLNPIQI